MRTSFFLLSFSITSLCALKGVGSVKQRTRQKTCKSPTTYPNPRGMSACIAASRFLTASKRSSSATRAWCVLGYKLFFPIHSSCCPLIKLVLRMTMSTCVDRRRESRAPHRLPFARDTTSRVARPLDARAACRCSYYYRVAFGFDPRASVQTSHA